MSVNAGATTATIPVSITDDRVREGSETILLYFVDDQARHVPGTPRLHTLTIEDEDLPLRAWFASVSQSAEEGSGTHNIVVNLSRAALSPVTLSYEVSGDASAGTDYVALSGTVTVPAGEATATIPVTLIDDVVQEDRETVVLTLSAGTGYTLGGRKAHTLILVDDDGPTPLLSFASSSSSVGEGAGTAEVTVNFDPAPASDIALAYTVGGTATSGTDYTALSGTVTVPAGEATATIPVTLIDDVVQEDRETVVLTLSAGTGYTLGGRKAHTLILVDDDGPTPPPPLLSFVSSSSSVGEGAGTAEVTVNFDPAPASDIALAYTVGGTATSGTDYTALTGSVSVKAGTEMARIPVTIIDDVVQEYRETVVLTLSAGTGYTLGGRKAHTLILVDDDSSAPPPPLLSFASSSSSVGEGAGTAEVTVNFDPAPTDSLPFLYYVIKSGSATTGDDFLVRRKANTQPKDGSISGLGYVAKGARSATIRVDIVDDTAQESSETVVLQLKKTAGYAPGSPDIHTLTIVDNDGASPPSTPVVSFATDAASADEGAGTRDVTVNLSPAPASDIALAYTVGGTATSGTDYTALSGSVSVKSGATTATIRVAIADDRVAESPETVVLTLSAGTGYTLGGVNAHTLTIADDDPSLRVTFASAASTAREVSGTHDVTLNLRPVPAADITLFYTVGGTATSGTDYTALSGTVAVSAGDRTATVPVAIIDDSVEDSGETVVLTLTGGTGYTVGSPKTHTLTIVNRDPDAAPAAFVPDAALVAAVTAKRDGFAPSHGAHGRLDKVLKGMTGETGGYTAAECRETATGFGVLSTWKPWCDEIARREAHEANAAPDPTPKQPTQVAEISIAGGAGVTEGGDAVFTLTADPAPASALTVDVTVTESGGYATAGSHTVTIPTGGTVELRVATTDDDADEPDGSVTATLASGTGYTVSATANAATVAVSDDDDAAPAAFVPDAALVAAVTAKRDGFDPSHAAHGRLDKVLKGMTGEAGGYTAAECRESATDFGVLSTWKPWCDEIARREAHEANAAPDATPKQPPTPAPEISIAAGAGVTEGGEAVFTLTASPAPSAALAVEVTVAEAGGYATASTQQVTVPTGGTVELRIATTDDDADEPDGSVTATVASGTGYTVSATANAATVAVSDDDDPAPVVSIAAKASSVSEGGAAAFTVTADPAPAADLTVELAVSEAQGSDYVASGDEGTKSVTILAGETEATFTVATVDDDVDEPDGSVSATLGANAGYTVSTTESAATVTVTDDDASGGVTLSISDARAHEGSGVRMTFALSLSEPVPGFVLVKFRTRDSSPRSAESGRDYLARRGSLTLIRPGETSGEVWIHLRDDAHDEGEETFEVEIMEVDSRAQGVEVTITDGVGVGTIVNSDPMPAAWLARFGRTVAEQALDGIAGRMEAARTPGMQGSLAGQAIGIAPESEHAALSEGAGMWMPGGEAAGRFGASAGRFGDDRFGEAHTPLSQTMTAHEALLGSRFSLTGETDSLGGTMALWGRASHGSFGGEERGDGTTVSLDGEVTTGMLGADYARGRWLVGIALTQSEGEGGYRPGSGSGDSDGDTAPPDGTSPDAAMAGTVESSLTATMPYAALQASERLKLWGALGYGTGEVTLTPDEDAPMKADTDWTMAAAGMRGNLLTPSPEGGPALALVSDALWARTSSEKTRELVASESDVTRLRLGLEGSWHLALDGGGSPGPGSGASLTPKLELGMRHDGGDAETGFGVELGGGIAWIDPMLGLSLDLSGRTLIAHEDGDLEDRGVSASLAFDPDPASERGPSFSLRQDFGGQANGGLDALFAPDPLEDRTGSEATNRWTAEAAYGFRAFGGRFTASPHVGLGLSVTARDYSLGWRWTPAANADAPDLSFGVRATLRESGTAEAEHSVGIEVGARW